MAKVGEKNGKSFCEKDGALAIFFALLQKSSTVDIDDFIFSSQFDVRCRPNEKIVLMTI